MRPRSALHLVALAAGALTAACSSSAPSGLPGPGPTPPGQACSAPQDCGCWTCVCEGLSGVPGSAQLCLSGACPTGEAACAPVCATRGATVASASAMSTCIGRP